MAGAISEQPIMQEARRAPVAAKNLRRRRRTRQHWYFSSLAVCGVGGFVVLLICFRWYTGHLDYAAGDAVFRRRLNAYPEDPFLKKPYNEDPNNWLVFIHCIGMLYMLLGLNTVCDFYFAGALEVMVQTWGIKDDVAGATFMAAGGSAPELFTSLLGAVVSESDVGFGTIVGSAVFNVLFVIGCCGMVAPGGINLTWWPLFRDCVWYICGLSTLAFFSNSGNSINLMEAAILFGIYWLYCLFMVFNEGLEKKAFSVIDRRFNNGVARVQPQAPTIKDREVGKSDDSAKCPAAAGDSKDGKTSNGNGTGAKGTSYGKLEEEGDEATAPADATTKDDNASGRPVTTEKVPTVGDVENGIAVETPGEEEGPEDEEEEDDEHFFAFPEGAIPQLIWYLSYPVLALLYYFTPEPRPEGGRFLMAFFTALVWIAIFSTLLVWWIEILTEVLQLPIIIMGFTVLAAGTSIPDLISSMAVAREGRGDMAVSSSIGSNIFDILVGLPIPWMLKIGIIETVMEENKGFEVKIKSPYITFYVLTLLAMVIATIVSIHINKWRLNKCLGPSMVSLWLVFLAIAISVEQLEPDLGPLR